MRTMMNYHREHSRHRLTDTVDPVWAWSPYEHSDNKAWTHQQAGHLLRRATLGFTWAELERARQDGMTATIDQLFDFSVNESFDRDMDATGKLVAATQEPRRLSSWWLLRMAQTPNSVLEKLTLFWHGHFATSGDKVRDNRALYAQNELLREKALGEFEPLVHAIARDVAMLIYLDTTDNRKTRPNENFARELLELFCLGIGNYSERDIQQLARCFTGWEVRSGQFRFNEHQHDRGEKEIFGQRRAFDATDAMRLVLQQPSAARFIAKKLVRFYVTDEVELSNELLEPLAQQLREQNFKIEPILRRIFSSNYFYSEFALGQKVRSPVELSLNLIRMFGVATNMDELSGQLEILGQLPYFPPNVKGWDGGRQWINAATLLARNQLARRLVQRGTTSTQVWSQAVPTTLAKQDSQTLVDTLLAAWLAVRPPEEIVSLMLPIAETNRREPEKRVPALFEFLVCLPEFQLG